MTQKKFDKFNALVPGDYPLLKPFFKHHHDHCAYVLPTILVWSSHLFQPWGGIINDDLVIGLEYEARFSDKRHLIMPLSKNGQVKDHRYNSPEKLYEIAETLGFHQYWFATEDWLKHQDEKALSACFDIQEQPGLDDYVYRQEDLAGLKGSRYAKKRNLIKQFEKAYVIPDRVHTAAITRSDVQECLEFIEKWCLERDCDANPDEDLACEKQAVINMLDQIDHLEVGSLLLRVDNAVCAIAIGTRLNETMGVMPFEKAFSDFKGLYQYFDRECARQLFKDFIYINKESDMDMPGLAKAKRSYYPEKMVKAFQLTLR